MQNHLLLTPLPILLSFAEVVWCVSFQISLSLSLSHIKLEGGVWDSMHIKSMYVFFEEKIR